MALLPAEPRAPESPPGPSGPAGPIAPELPLEPLTPGSPWGPSVGHGLRISPCPRPPFQPHHLSQPVHRDPWAPRAPGEPDGPAGTSMTLLIGSARRARSAYSPSGHTGRRAQIKVTLYRAGHPAVQGLAGLDAANHERNHLPGGILYIYPEAATRLRHRGAYFHCASMGRYFSARDAGVAPFTLAMPITTWGGSCWASAVIGSAASIATMASRARILRTFAIDSSDFITGQCRGAGADSLNPPLQDAYSWPCLTRLSGSSSCRPRRSGSWYHG